MRPYYHGGGRARAHAIRRLKDHHVIKINWLTTTMESLTSADNLSKSGILAATPDLEQLFEIVIITLSVTDPLNIKS